jgi:predicted MFS family arabinose efflux permease
MEVVVFSLIDEGLHRAPAFLGVLSTTQGVGAVLGGVIVGTTMRRLGELRTIAWALVAAAAGVGLLATAQLAVVLVATAAIGVAVSFYNVAFVTLMQRRTDVTMQGRVMSAVEAAFTLPFAVSLALGAALVSVVSFRPAYLAVGGVFLGVAAYLAVTTRTGDPVEVPGGAGVPLAADPVGGAGR